MAAAASVFFQFPAPKEVQALAEDLRPNTIPPARAYPGKGAFIGGSLQGQADEHHRDYTERFPAGRLATRSTWMDPRFSERPAVSMQRWAGALAGTCALAGSSTWPSLAVLLLFAPYYVALFLKCFALPPSKPLYYKTMKLHSFLFMKSEPTRASYSYKKAKVPIFNT